MCDVLRCLVVVPQRVQLRLEALPGPDLAVQMGLRPIRCSASCALPLPVIQTKHSSLPPKGKPEFHAEWLRDEPCDATTTCPRKTGVWCQLLPGDGEHEIRGSLQHSWPKRLARYFESYSRSLFIEPVTRSYTLSHSHICEGFVTTAYELRCRECGKILRDPAAFHL